MQTPMNNADMRDNLIFVKQLLGAISNRLSVLHDNADGPYYYQLKTVFSNVDSAEDSLGNLLHRELSLEKCYP